MATGGSLVSDILKKSSALDERLLDESVQKLTKKSTQLKGEVCEFLKQNYVEFQSYVDTTVSLEQKVAEASAEHRRLSSRIEHELKGRILRAADRRQEIESRLRETQERIQFVEGLVSIHQGLESARSHIQSEKLYSAASCLNDAAACLDGAGKAGCEAKVYRALKSELALVISDLTLKLRITHICWTPKSLPENPNLDALVKVRLSAPIKGSSSADAFSEVIAALLSLTPVDLWEEQIRLFSQKLLRAIVRPLIVNPALKAVRTREKDAVVLKLVRNEVDEGGTHARVLEVYDSLTTALAFVGQVVPEYYQGRWMGDIGEWVCPKMAELIVQHCLASTIPKSLSEMERYGEISLKTLEFEATLVTLGVVSEDFHELSDYTRNVNTHFAAKKCQDLLVKTREILMKPIHDTVLVTNANALENLSQLEIVPSLPPISAAAQSDDDKLQLQSQSKGVDLNALSFAFPACTISKVVQEYVKLLYATLNECCNSGSQSVAVQLFYTTRSMVDLFCAVIPSHHKAAITEVPRIAAVQHNNCMYVAHHLVPLGHQFHARLPAPLDSESSTFIDLVPLVRQLGEECFLAEMRKQANVIRDCLKAFGGFDSISSDPKCERARKGVRQALLQVHKLSKVYAEVLPREIHRKSVGALLNTLTSTIVSGVLSLEDIAASDASELHSIITTLVLKEGSTLLPTGDGEEAIDLLSTYCGQWGKLRELAVVLDASLVDIQELWGAGRGPLAQQFSPVELRSLIKAIFRNTERRAEVLAKITV